MDHRIGEIIGAFVFCVLGIVGLSYWAHVQEQAIDRQQAAVAAQNRAAEKAAWDALTPQQHTEAARGALAKGDTALALRHAGALPKAQGDPIRAKVAQLVAARKAEAKRQAEIAAKAERQSPGPKPDAARLELILELALKKTAHDPDSVADVTVYRPSEAKAQGVACWKSPFSFRARNGFGALRITHGEIWTKNGEILQNRFEE